jgi:Sec-independent protein secretion pathway component TatC
VAPNLSCGLLLAILLFVPCIFYLAWSFILLL